MTAIWSKQRKFSVAIFFPWMWVELWFILHPLQILLPYPYRRFHLLGVVLAGLLPLMTGISFPVSQNIVPFIFSIVLITIISSQMLECLITLLSSDFAEKEPV